MKARHLAESMATLRDQITRWERRRDELVATHPDASIFASFPGAGRATVPRLIAAFGTRRERYQSAFEVECDSGIAPVHIRSGKIDRVSIRRACQDFTRQTFHEFAGQTIPQCEWAKDFYQAHCHRPEQHHAAVRALAFKWIRILFRCWKDRKPYDEQLYLTSLRRRSGLLGTWSGICHFCRVDNRRRLQQTFGEKRLTLHLRRLRGKLANLANRQLLQRSNGRLLRNKRSVMID